MLWGRISGRVLCVCTCALISFLPVLWSDLTSPSHISSPLSLLISPLPLLLLSPNFTSLSLPPRSPPCTHPFAPQFVYPSYCLALTSAILSTTHSIKDGSVLHLPSPVSTPSPHLSLSRLVLPPVRFISSCLLLQRRSTKHAGVWLQCDCVLCLCRRPHV